MARSRRAAPHDPELVPVTESLIKLLLWLKGPPKRTGSVLARATGYSQQHISSILCRQLRPDPASECAHLFALVTGGVVTPEGWLLPEEARAREDRRRQAAEHGERLQREASRAPGRQHTPMVGDDLARRLGLVAGASRRARISASGAPASGAPTSAAPTSAAPDSAGKAG